jgi:hypothetical protein
MPNNNRSATYRQHAKAGPFPAQVDPFAETGRYFQQIHASMINRIVEDIQDTLWDLGYVAGSETSLQILDKREPDVFVRREADPLPPPAPWDYPAAAEAIHTSPGLAVETGLPELQSIDITSLDDGRLVTVLEIVSPSNKAREADIQAYRIRRYGLLTRGVNLVEIDLTRSAKRLMDNHWVPDYAYHVAIYLPQQPARLLGMTYGAPLEPFALPLRGDVVPVDVQKVYQYAYGLKRIAVQINQEDGYRSEKLPFPSLLSDKQKVAALAAVEAWQPELARLAVE